MKAEQVEKLLAKPAIHEKWEGAYRTVENARFFDEAFARIVRVLNAREGATFLDAGCGPCAHSIRMAKRGFLVQAVDCSESALAMAQANVRVHELRGRIRVQRGNVLALPFEAGSFDYVLCWGVLMHVPDVRKAVAECARVLRRGGMCVVSESNMRSLQAILLRRAKRLLGKEKVEVRRTVAGIESWAYGPDGALVTRETDIRWLIESFREDGLVLKTHVPGQFTEAYTRVSSTLLVKLIHGFNRWYFRRSRMAGLAFGNILIFQKEQ